MTHGRLEWFATPRRLAVRVVGVADHQPDQDIKRQGPAIANAFDASGQPTKAALGFAASCGVSLEDLQQVDGPKGKVLQYVGVKPGEATIALLPGIVTAALNALPIARRMRWGAGEQEFVRPVHWVRDAVRIDVVETSVLGIASGQAHARSPVSCASGDRDFQSGEVRRHLARQGPRDCGRESSVASSIREGVTQPGGWTRR